MSRVLSDHAITKYTWWNPSRQPSRLIDECILRIQPLLKAKKIRELTEAMQVSKPYAVFVRSGRRPTRTRGTGYGLAELVVCRRMN
jgi:hypothetical protein